MTMDTIAQPILSTPEAVTPERLTQVLRAAGCLRDAHVTAVSHEAIGVGLLGDTMRLHISYDDAEPTAPSTLAGKFPATDPHARESGRQIGVYQTEANFYSQIASQLPVRAPLCYYSELEPVSCEFGLLLEDMGPARAADQIEGCSRADAEHALLQAAALHAPRFGDESLWSIGWMDIRRHVLGGVCANFTSHTEVFLERFADHLSADHRLLVERFAPRVHDFVMRRPERSTLIHGDFRLDNMLFDCQGGDVPVCILDWQSIAPENPGLDFAYFLSTSYPADQRSRDERELLRLYHEEVQTLGAREYSWEDLWTDYRQSAWLGLFTAIFASSVSKRTERSDRLFKRMAEGSAALMLEHDTLASL